MRGSYYYDTCHVHFYPNVLGFDTRKCLKSAALAMNLHVSYFKSDIIVFNLKKSGKYSKPTIELVEGSKSLFLKWLNTGQWNKKWASSSIVLGQNGQNLSSGCNPSYLPVSIASLWFESLNLVTCWRMAIFLISIRYFSIPGSSLNKAYVLNLLEFSLIAPKEDSWKPS